MVGVIVLDLDDTLIAERDFALSGFRAIDKLVQDETGFSGFAEAAAAEFDAGTRGKIFNVVLRKLAGRDDTTLIDKMVEAFRTHIPTLALTADARVFLEQIKKRSLPAALISDGDHRTQRNKVRALDLEGDFTPLILTGDWGREFWKPHPRAFETVMQVYGRPPSEFVYIADNPAKDFVTPRRLGWRTIRIARPGSEHAGAVAPDPRHEADSRVISLTDIDLAALTRAPA